MKRFWRKKNDAEYIADDFTLRTPFSGYRPVGYRISPEIYSFKKELDRCLARLFKGELDSGNANTLDNLIFDVTNSAAEDVNRQHTSHTDRINSLWIRRQGDRMSISVELETLRRELAETEATLAEMKKNGGM